MPQNPFGIEQGSLIDRGARGVGRATKRAATLPLDVSEAVIAGLIKADPNEFLRTHELNQGAGLSPFEEFDPEIPAVPSAPSPNFGEQAQAGLQQHLIEAQNRPPAPRPSPAPVSDPSITGLQAAAPRSNYNPADAASTLGGGGQMSANLPGELNSLREDRLIEMMRNRELAAGSGGMMGTGATGTDVNALSSLLQTDPTTGTAQRERFAEMQRKSDEATMGGFGSPQAAARSAQAMEQSKIDAPIRAQEATAAGNVEVAKINQKPYADFLNMIKGGQGQTGLGPGDSLSIGGLGSFHKGSAGNVPTQIYRDIAVAKRDMLAAGETDWLGRPTQQKQIFPFWLFPY